MHPLSPLFFISVLFIALATAFVLELRYGIVNEKERFQSIDGLRGFLALNVFICHASVWHQYLQIGAWIVPKSNLFTQLGQTSVALFFMITSFLFVGKVLNTKGKDFDWNFFFISRLYRIAPMYYFSVIIIFLFAFFATKWEIQRSFFSILHSFFDWGIFTMIREPAINGYNNTSIINAGVVWSLPFEWLFYFGLPIFALFIGQKPSIYFIMISVFVFVLYLYFHRVFHLSYFLSFSSGALAAFLVRYKPNFKINHLPGNAIIVACLFGIIQFSTADNHFCKFLIAIVFILVAYGNSLFGVFHIRAIKFLGEICYSTYLIHGLILYATIYFGIGIEKAKTLSPSEYCLVILFVTPIVIVLSFLGFRFIEKPFIEKAQKIRAQKK
jgi:peptidoglycan/LPS O-acetylase OafA/YrhL